MRHGVLELLERPPAGIADCSGFGAALGNGEPLSPPPDPWRAALLASARLCRVWSRRRCMTVEDYVRALLALLFVLGLLVGLYLVLKRLQLRGFLGNLGPAGEPGGRLELLSSLGLGGRRQIIIVGRGHVRYVILCSPTRDLLLETYQKTESGRVGR